MADNTMVVCPHCDAVNRVPRAKLRDRPTCGKCKQPLFDAHPVALTDGNFDRHLSHSDLPLVVDFCAQWRGPCKVMAPAYEQAAARIYTWIFRSRPGRRFSVRA